MGAHLELEVDNGEFLQLRSPSGSYGGKAVATLCSLIPNYKEIFKPGTWQYAWFERLDEQAEHEPGLIGRITYSGNWEYHEREFDQFRRSEEMFANLTELDFLRTIHAVAAMWTPIEDVIESAQELARLLPEMGASTDWFSPHDTLEGFEGLIDALQLAKQRGGERVRFRGS